MGGNPSMDAEGPEIQLEIFDPPMCCAGGVCGPDVDPELLTINEALLTIQKEYPGRVAVRRYILSQSPAKFMENAEVAALLRSEGVRALPTTMLNGRIVKKGAYASLSELRAAVLSA